MSVAPKSAPSSSSKYGTKWERRGEAQRTKNANLDEVVALEERGDEARREGEEVGDFRFKHAVSRGARVSLVHCSIHRRVHSLHSGDTRERREETNEPVVVLVLLRRNLEVLLVLEEVLLVRKRLLLLLLELRVRVVVAIKVDEL
jgi:hypothetical protein